MVAAAAASDGGATASTGTVDAAAAVGVVRGACGARVGGVAHAANSSATMTSSAGRAGAKRNRLTAAPSETNPCAGAIGRNARRGPCWRRAPQSAPRCRCAETGCTRVHCRACSAMWTRLARAKRLPERSAPSARCCPGRACARMRNWQPCIRDHSRPACRRAGRPGGPARPASVRDCPRIDGRSPR